MSLKFRNTFDMIHVSDSDFNNIIVITMIWSYMIVSRKKNYFLVTNELVIKIILY